MESISRQHQTFGVASVEPIYLIIFVLEGGPMTSCNLQGVTFFSSWSLVCQDTKRAIRIYEGLNDKKGEATRVQQTLHPYLLEMTYPFNVLGLVFRPPVLASFEHAWTTASFFLDAITSLCRHLSASAKPIVFSKGLAWINHCSGLTKMGDFDEASVRGWGINVESSSTVG